MNSKIIQVVILISAFILFDCSGPASGDRNKTVTQQSVVNDLPNMTINLIDGSELKIKELTGKTILIFFQPDCDHCQREATEIQTNLEAFRHNKLYFISTSRLKDIEEFAIEYKLSGHPNIFFAATSLESILKNFGSIATPSIYIYSGEHRLIKTFNGEVKIEMVLQYI